MTLHAVLFYLFAAVILLSTGLAITRRNMIHTIIYLVVSFFGTAMLFYLLGAPLLAALEVIIYAGAIMILFLFIIMMLKDAGLEQHLFPVRQGLPALGICFLFLILGSFLAISSDDTMLEAAIAEPLRFGMYLFQAHWLSIEIASMLLLIALVGALHLGKEPAEITPKPTEEDQ